MSDDDRVIDAEFDLSDVGEADIEEGEEDRPAPTLAGVEGEYTDPTIDNQTGQPVHTLHPDPEGLLRELAEREEAGDGFPDQFARLMANPSMMEAVERARWGTVLVLNAGQQSGLLCMVHRDVPTSWIVQTLPDTVNLPPNPNTRYRIIYGSGGALRASGLLLPGLWICHGSDVQVIAISANIAAASASFAAFITPAPGAIPNIP